MSFLSIRAGDRLSQREIAIALSVSPTAVANTVKNLIKKEYIILEKIKTINFISLNRNNPKVIEYKKIENQKQLYNSGVSEYLEELFPATTIILFGSYQKGEDVAGSDIDIAVINGKEKRINFEKYEKILNRKINVNVYKSWKEIHKSLKNNILSGMLLHGVISL